MYHPRPTLLGIDGRTLLRGVANRYNASVGLPAVPESLSYVQVDRPFAWRVAAAYDALPCHDGSIETWEAYDALRREVADQFASLSNEGIRFDRYDSGEPYANSAAMMDDIFTNGHLYVFFGGADHPALSRHQNWQFRAVHDVFGHALHGYQFGPRGEENAYRAHRLMFTPLAVKALTTETRGQNSWVNFGPFSHLPPRERPYADQKAALLPEWCLDLN